jgi:hypothetical protein
MKIPMIIEIIIGEIGLFSNSKSLEPKILDILIDIIALNTQRNIPNTSSLSILNIIWSIFYYT